MSKKLTKWMSCATPPVREGEYDCRGKFDYFGRAQGFPILWNGSQYLLINSPQTSAGGVAMNYPNWAEHYEWRGLAEQPK